MKLWFLILMSLTTGLYASDSGTTAANFLKLGIGPRAIAMGNAQVGLADDVYSTYWNPAGLAHLSLPQAGLVHTQHVEGITEQYLAYAKPTASLGTFAGSFSYLNVGTFQGYDAAGQPTGQVGANDAVLGLSYGKVLFHNSRLGSEVAVGATGKWIQERLDTVSARAYAMDLGLFAEPGKAWRGFLNGWKGGVVLQNIGTALKFDRESFDLPRQLAAGLSYTGALLGQTITVALDGRQPNDGPRTMGLGLEAWAQNTVALRAGYTSQGDLGNGLRVGAGLRLKNVQVDYAFAGAGSLGNTHRFGLTFSWGRPSEDPLYIAQDWYEKGEHDFLKGRYTDALLKFNKALEIDPSHPQALQKMKETYEKIKTGLLPTP